MCARISMSAILNWIAWLAPIGFPKACRSLAYFTDSSTQPCARPVDSAEMAIRPSSRIRRNCAYPRPSSPSRFAAGTRTSEKDSSRVSDAFHPTLEYGAATVKPGVPDGTMIAEMRGAPFSLRPVTAVTVTSSVMSVPELVMKHLEPLITHSPVASSRTAVVRVPPASEPPSGSVSPNAPSASPVQSFGSHRCFCSSVPKR